MLRDDLRRSLDALPHAGRVRRMVELGSTTLESSKAGIAAAAVLAELRGGSAYERRLALYATWGSRDATIVMAGLADPSRLARGLSRHLACMLCDEAQLADAVEGVPPPARRAMLTRARRHGRYGVVDAVLQGLAARRDPGFGSVLHLGSKAFVARHLPDAAMTVAGLDWRALARAHAQAAAEWLTEAVRATAELDSSLAAKARTALVVLAERLPDAAVVLAGALARHVPLASLPLQTLVSRRPLAAADLYLSVPGPCLVSFASVVHRLDRTRLLALLARFGDPGDRSGAPGRWLRALSPALRAEVYELLHLRWRNRDGAIALPILALLPRPVREAEAHRHLALPAFATRPATHMPYAGLLGWEEAHSHVAPFLGDPDADLRAAALSGLAGSLRFDRERARDLLALALGRRFEQDPVRCRLLGAMADLPPSTWDASHLPDLGTVFRQALDAADLSSATAMHIGRIIAAQLPRHLDWAAGWLVVVARERGSLTVPGLDRRLSRQDLKRIAPALEPVLREWRLRERDVPVLALASSLGRHLAPAWDGLADMLEQIARRGTAQSAASALQVLAERRHDRLRTLVPLLLRDDPSWATKPPVYNHLHRHRQDLLTPFLGRTPYKGRFATGDTAIVLPFRNGFARWTPAQQVLFAGSLGSIIADEKRDSLALLGAIRQLAALPDTERDALERLATLDEPRAAAREAALRGLGRRDTGDGLPVLLAALDDERARIAAYALRRGLLEMPASRALGILGGLPWQKVTVAKEVVRLAGELPGEDAYRWLLDRAARNETTAPLHRDVFVSLARKDVRFW